MPSNFWHSIRNSGIRIPFKKYVRILVSEIAAGSAIFLNESKNSLRL